MSSRSKFLVLAVVSVAAAAVAVGVLPVQGAKPAPAISLQANFEEFVVDGENQYRIANDVSGVAFIDTADRAVGKKTVPSGVQVKYYPPGGADQIGRFKMTIDQTGFLQRFVRLLFLEPSVDTACDESGYPGFPVDPLGGGIGTLLTTKISITAGGVLVKNADGALVWDTSKALDMDKMLAGQSKWVLFGITFNPAGTFSDRSYMLGILTGAGVQGNVICPPSGYALTGSAELYCVESGRVWQFRPYAATFPNAPDNVTRLLHTNVQLDFLHSIKLRTWNMPFVLTVTKQ